MIRGQCSGAGRDKGNEAFIEDILFTVYPDLDFAAQVIGVFTVGANEGYCLIERMAVLFGVGVGVSFFRPFPGPEPGGLHEKSAFFNAVIQGN